MFAVHYCTTIYLLWNVYVYPAFSHVLLTDNVVGSDLSLQLLHEKLINFFDCHHIHVISFSVLLWALIGVNSSILRSV